MHGRINDVPSHTLTTTYDSVISSIRPHWSTDVDDVVDADGIGEGDLQAGEEVAERRLGGEAGDDADDAGRGEDGGAELLSSPESSTAPRRR